ncbi:Odorant receptor [Nesidiocoris tenuis]|uniref:Odorant receptor n=1 Tax=Nesidiocoris tenuis TaxID=355587 RepID=A0ABN7ALB4_9HEMI|nr:Odorant receptor [Nesidiocoris tenuis]
MTIQPGQDLTDSNHIFRFQLWALRICMMWPADGGRKLISTAFKIILLCNSLVLSACTVLLLMKAIRTDDLVDRSEALDIFTLTGSANYKMVFFYYYHETFVDMAMCGLALTPHLPPNWTKNCTLFSRIHCFSGFFSISFWAMCPVLKYLSGESSWEKMGYPINMHDPFNSTGFLYFLLYVTGHYAIILSAHIYMAADCFLFTSIYVANGAFQTLQDKIERMESLKGEKDRYQQDEAHQYLKSCIKLHVHILDYMRKTDKLFRSMILVDVLHAIISLSFAMLQASESKGIFENLKMVFFVAVCFIHQYLNSHFGQNLIDQQTLVSDKVTVAVPWTEAPQTFKKTYMLLITGTQPVRKLSAWSVYKLQYSTFLEFVKSMISYYMVLRQLQDEADHRQSKSSTKLYEAQCF